MTPAERATPWSGGCRLWSFSEMLFSTAEPLIAFFRRLLILEEELQRDDPASRVSTSDLFGIETRIKTGTEAIDFLYLPSTFSLLDAFILHNSRHATSASVAQYVKSLRTAFRVDIAKLNILFMDATEADFFSRERPLGDAVAKAFPSAAFDLDEAGKCFACGRFNAAAYHLMCASEFGLRALARDRRVLLPKGRPLELEQWGKIIGELSKKVADINQWKATTSRERALQFYNSSLLEIRAFNDGWRRHLMHARNVPLQQDETSALFGHVGRFLRNLATEISEKTRKPTIWR